MQQYFWESCDDLKSPTNNNNDSKKCRQNKTAFKYLRKHEDRNINT